MLSLMAHFPPNITQPHGSLSNCVMPQRFVIRKKATANEPIVLLVDGLDEAPAANSAEMPFGLPIQLPPGTVVIATTRPGSRLPSGIGLSHRIRVESANNRRDLAEFVRQATVSDSYLTSAIRQAGMTNAEFCQQLIRQSGGVWIYVSTFLDEIREGSLYGQRGTVTSERANKLLCQCSISLGNGASAKLDFARATAACHTSS